jgi:hypothetical protein
MSGEGWTMNGRPASSIHHSSFMIHTAPVLAEIALVFAVFFMEGASPVPDVNEPYYLGKAIHYWNPDWARGDFFLSSKDTHEVFYYTFGWASLWLPPPALAWFGRILTWGLLAWAWRRLSFALLPRRWCSILTAALLVCLIERCNMAGEWVVGGVEAKGFAFVLVFLGLEALVRGRWNRAWLLLGAASAFHVLVGGWSVVAAGLAWLMLGSDRPPLKRMWPAVLGGFLLSLPGLIPALSLNWGTDAETVRLANQIYVYRRLYHHLDPAQIPVPFIVRFVLLSTVWLLLSAFSLQQSAFSVQHSAFRILRAFVAAAVAIALAGGAICWLSLYAEDLGATLLRFYWFRLADVAVPVGVALEGTAFALRMLAVRPAVGKGALAAAVAVAGLHLGVHLLRLPGETLPPAYHLSDQVADYRAWRRACDWVAHSGRIPPGALFITPGEAQTFKWYAGRGEVANWKEIPQDAAAILRWWQRMQDLYIAGPRQPMEQSPADLGAQRLQQAGEHYGADYVITTAQPRLDLKVVYENPSYVIYQLRKVEPPGGNHRLPSTDNGQLSTDD